ncbi:MAG: hypothetical protein E7523_12290 [Ruminococcaceae bacterium]|nr:hypothetical protein [Oscillospiraceae bacterium]
MKKRSHIFYVVLCFVISLIPFVCMTFAPEADGTLEKRELAKFPSVIEDGKFNFDILEELGDYFNDHFAFRQQMVAADALLLDKFGTSSVDSVIRGTDGWLYYTTSVYDYSGYNTISDRYAYNVAHTIAQTQKYVEANGGKFAYVVAPNKNSLYPEHMPYYLPVVDDENNMDVIRKHLNNLNVAFVDLFPVFEAEEEVLYLHRDSHWNNKGALLAYNTILDYLNIEHDDYSSAPYTKAETEYGDLGNMLYGVAAEPEWNYYYDIEQHYTHKMPMQSVEDPLIMTGNPDGEGNLLMFRDSFTNAMLPFFANEFSNAVFTRGQPYAVESYMQTSKPDVVMIEVGERGNFVLGYQPPIFTGAVTEITEKIVPAGENNSTLTFAKYANDTNFYLAKGFIDGYINYTDVYLCVNGVYYEAFTVTDTESNNDYGYMLYLNKNLFADENVEISVVINENGQYISVCDDKFTITEE